MGHLKEQLCKMEPFGTLVNFTASVKIKNLVVRHSQKMQLSLHVLMLCQKFKLAQTMENATSLAALEDGCALMSVLMVSGERMKNVLWNKCLIMKIVTRTLARSKIQPISITTLKIKLTQSINSRLFQVK